MVGAMIVYGVLLAVGPGDYKILVNIQRTVNLSEQQDKAFLVLELPLLCSIQEKSYISVQH